MYFLWWSSCVFDVGVCQSIMALLLHILPVSDEALLIVSEQRMVIRVCTDPLEMIYLRKRNSFYFMNIKKDS